MRPTYSRSSASSAVSIPSLPPTPHSHTPRSSTPTPSTSSVPHTLHHGHSTSKQNDRPVASLGVKRVTLTSKKNWWLVEMEEEEENDSFSSDTKDVSMSGNIKEHGTRAGAGPVMNGTANSFSSSEETAVLHEHEHGHDTHPVISQPYADVDPGSRSPTPSPDSSPHVFHPPDRHPSVIFSFPTPTSYAAPPNATANIAPYATGSTSELFKCIVKKPEVVQLEINGDLQTNASDVTTQFLAELRVYTTIGRHRNIVGFLGCLEGVGMVLEYIDGRTLFEVVRSRPPLTRERKIDYHNQLLDALTHLHSHGLSHGDLSLLNIYVTRTDTLKVIDFGRSVAADSMLASPHDAPADPFAFLTRSKTSGRVYPLATGPSKRRKVEQIHPGTRPFTAPEILRGECQDARLADAYSFGVILSCLDQCALVDCDPAAQARDEVPQHFLDGCEVFQERIGWYLQPLDKRRRLSKDDFIAVKHWWDEEE